jgi:hypothetical protein
MLHFDKLKKWLKINDTLKMMEKETRGIISTKDIYKGDIIMEIPYKYLIELTYCTKYISKFIHKEFESTNSIIAVYILLESLNNKTKWKYYFDSLPNDFNNYIYFYKKNKMDLLKNSTMMCKDTQNFSYNIDNIKKDSLIAYNELKQNNKLPKKYLDINEFTNLFIKYRIIVDSRAFTYEKKNEFEVGLVPYADLFNHSYSSNIYWYFDDTKKAFIVQAFEDIKSNSEIFFSYGEKSNIQLVIHYGFSLKNNPYSDLSFMYKNKKITLSKNSNLDLILNLFQFIEYKNQIIKYLQKKLLLHQEYIKKTRDYNIRNILNDEIQIIRTVLDGPKHPIVDSMTQIDISKNLNFD